jgi:bla regulator protein blaR1
MTRHPQFWPATIGVLALIGISSTPQAQAQSSGQTAADRPAFDAASVKPNRSAGSLVTSAYQPGGRYRGTNVTLEVLVNTAYQLKAHQLIADAEWRSLLAERFDIEANAEGNPSKEQMNAMLQSLLAERFKLAVHREIRPVPIYALVLARAGKIGPQLTPHSEDAPCMDPVLPGPPQAPGAIFAGVCEGFYLTKALGLREIGHQVSMEMVATTLSPLVDRIVVDKTGLGGFFDLTLDFMPPMSAPTMINGQPSAPELFTALQEQLGLKLEAQTAPVEVLVIDHVEEPSAN